MKLDDEVKPKQKHNKSPGYKGNNVCKEVSLEDGESCGCGCGPKPKPVPPSVLKGDYVQDSHYVHTDNNFTDADKEKLESVEAGAEVNVQADWSENNPSSDAYIKNKPDITHPYRKDYFVSGLNPIDIEYDNKIFGEYPPIRIYTEWDIEIFGDIKYTLISGTLMKAQVYFNQSPGSGYYILG